jgi:hypothetical protein
MKLSTSPYTPWDRNQLSCPCIHDFPEQLNSEAGNREVIRLVEETETHILIRLLLSLLLLLFLWCLLGSSTSSSGCSRSTWGSGGTTSRSDVQEDVFDIFAFEGLS